MNQYIDVIYYINLDHRTDRNEQIMDELQKMEINSEKIVRIPAMYREHGDVGCSLSHAKTIETFLASPHQHCLILEDDFMFTMDKDTTNGMIDHFFSSKINYDVCNLSTNMHPRTVDHSEYSFVKCVLEASTTSGYMLSKQFASTLLNNVREGAHLLETECYAKNNISLKFHYAVDSYWKHLQPTSQWYMFWPKLGKQRASWSDVQQNYEDYNT